MGRVGLDSQHLGGGEDNRALAAHLASVCTSRRQLAVDPHLETHPVALGAE